MAREWWMDTAFFRSSSDSCFSTLYSPWREDIVLEMSFIITCVERSAAPDWLKVYPFITVMDMQGPFVNVGTFIPLV